MNNTEQNILKEKKRRKYVLMFNRNRRKMLVKKHKCLSCYNKISPIKCPHCKKVIKYPVRHLKCSRRNSR